MIVLFFVGGWLIWEFTPLQGWIGTGQSWWGQLTDWAGEAAKWFRELDNGTGQ